MANDGAPLPLPLSQAGGFLAKGWNDYTPVGPLSDLSFNMHEQLAKDLNLKSYRRMTCSAVAVDGGGKPLSKKLANVEWVDLGTKVIALMCRRGFHPK